MSTETFSPETERAFRDAFFAAVNEGLATLHNDDPDIGDRVNAAYDDRGCGFSRTGAETDPVFKARLRGRHHGLIFLRNIWVTAPEHWEPVVDEWCAKVTAWAALPCDKLVPPPFHPDMLVCPDTTSEFFEENVDCVTGPQDVSGLWQPFPLRCLPAR